MPTERVFPAVGKVDGHGAVLVCGGLDASSFAVASCDKYTRQTTFFSESWFTSITMLFFFKFKIQRTLWQKAEPMLNARAKMAYFSDGQKMYVAGGLGASGGPIDSVEVYEIGRWTTKMSLPTATEG